MAQLGCSTYNSVPLLLCRNGEPGRLVQHLSLLVLHPGNLLSLPCRSSVQCRPTKPKTADRKPTAEPRSSRACCCSSSLTELSDTELEASNSMRPAADRPG